jgi:hypothetical protein
VCRSCLMYHASLAPNKASPKKPIYLVYHSKLVFFDTARHIHFAGPFLIEHWVPSNVAWTLGAGDSYRGEQATLHRRSTVECQIVNNSKVTTHAMHSNEVAVPWHQSGICSSNQRLSHLRSLSPEPCLSYNQSITSHYHTTTAM